MKFAYESEGVFSIPGEHNAREFFQFLRDPRLATAPSLAFSPRPRFRFGSFSSSTCETRWPLLAAGIVPELITCG